MKIPPVIHTVKTIVTYMEMVADPGIAVQSLPNTYILPAQFISADFYRKLYIGAGRDVDWTDRLLLSDEELLNILNHPAVEIHILYVDSAIAGFAELDSKNFPDIELKYFGLFPSFRGKGYGQYFLRSIIDYVWKKNPRRFWLHTNDRDHPAAVALYKKHGFVPYDQRIEDQAVIGEINDSSGNLR